MHYIQKHILDELRAADSVRYAQLNTAGVESGHFRYHLQQLVKDGYVSSATRGLYGLTPKGQNFVDKLSASKIHPENMPKVITYTLLRHGDNILLQRKAKQPYLGLLNMVGGKLHEGETAAAAAVREVYEKTGLQIETPQPEGVYEVIVRQHGTVLSHAVAFVFSLTVDDPGSLESFAVEQLASAKDLAPDLMPILERIGQRPISNGLLEIELAKD